MAQDLIENRKVHFVEQLPFADECIEKNHNENIAEMMAIAESYIKIGMDEHGITDQKNVNTKVQMYLSRYHRYQPNFSADYIEEIVDNVFILASYTNCGTKFKMIDYLYHMIETKIESSLYAERIAVLGLPEDIFNEIAIKDNIFNKCRLTLSKQNFLTNEALQLKVLLEIDHQINLVLEKTEMQKVKDIHKECHNYFAYLANNLKSEVNKDKFHNVMPQLMNTLDEANTMCTQKLQDFKNLFIAKSPILTKSPDSATVKFLKNIGHLLTLGVNPLMLVQ